MANDRFEKGMEIRKAWLGAEYVDKSMKGADKFSMPMQEFATESCWGTAWTRPGLPHKTRSLINLAMLTALDRQAELALHVRAAIQNGITVPLVIESGIWPKSAMARDEIAVAAVAAR